MRRKGMAMNDKPATPTLPEPGADIGAEDVAVAAVHSAEMAAGRDRAAQPDSAADEAEKADHTTLRGLVLSLRDRWTQ